MKNILQKKQTKIFIAAFLFLLLIVSIQFINYKNRFIYNDSSTVGNTSGNLYNMGLFCEYGNSIYFSNPSDSNHLYSMDKDGTNIKKLNHDSSFFINVANGYIYYTRRNKIGQSDFFLRGSSYGVYRINLKNGKITQLNDSLAQQLSLVGNYLYFQEYSDEKISFSKVNINNKKDYTVLAEKGYKIASAEDGNLYYTSVEKNHNILKWNTTSDSSSLLISGNYYQPSFVDGFLYAIDLEKDYSLVKINLNTMEETTLSNEHCINYNVYEDDIYYQTENGREPNRNGLFRMKTDGTSNELVEYGNLMNLNITAEYTYFQYFGQEEFLYRTPRKGPINIQVFIPTVSE